ncbi:MAG: sensor domain-containing diguanylate cyclase [Pseudomonadota bacterium]
MRLAVNTVSLKFRLSVLVVALVLLATGLVAFSSLFLAERQMRAIVGAQQFALLSSAAAYIDADLGAKKTLLMTLREELAEEPASLQAFLETHGTLRDEFSNVVVYDRDGMVLASLNARNVSKDLNFSQRDYFIDTVAAREGIISRPFKSSLSQRPVVLVTEPVFDEAGKLRFMLAGAIDLQRPRFFGQLASLKSGSSGYLFMLTRDGTIIHHPDREHILRKASDGPGGVQSTVVAAMNGFEGWTEGPTKRGVPALITYKRLARTDWIIGGVYPLDEAFRPMIRMRTKALLASAAVALLAGVAGWLAILRLLRPLAALRKHVARISDGSAPIEVFDVDRRDEFGELSRAFFDLSRQRRNAEMNLEALARTDSLTGIHNRRMFEEIFALSIRRAQRSRRRLALAYLDIDHFKAINDTLGHGMGDQVLVEFASRLKMAVRATDTVARLAGDEFVIIFESTKGDADTTTLAEKIMEQIRPPFVFADVRVKVTTSVGIAIGGCDLTMDDFLKASDAALYDAKRKGRDGYSVRQLCPPQFPL